MRCELQQLAEDVRRAPNLDAFWNRIHTELEHRGASSILYGVLASEREVEVHRLTKALIWKGTHKREFFDVFGPESFVDDDVTAELCVGSSEVVFWNDMSNWDNATPAEQARARIERDLGFDVGFTVPSSHFSRRQIGGIGVSMPNIPIREFDKFWRQEGPALVSICGMLDTGMRGQHLDQLIRLSPREKECLIWLSVGLRQDQIAARLNIGRKSVEKYIANARFKLKAATSDHAVAKALIFGLIEP